MSYPRLRDAPGAAFHLTNRVNWRTWHLAPKQYAATFLRLLEESLRLFYVDLLAFVLMSNHFHLVVVTPPATIYRRLTSRRTRCRHWVPYPKRHQKSTVLGQLMKRVNYCTARAIQRDLGISGRFWEYNYHARQVEDRRDLLFTIAYDHFNPVVQGMVTRPEDHAGSSAAWWAQEGDSPIELATADLPFGLQTDELRCELLRLQCNRQFPEVVEIVRAEGLQLHLEADRKRLLEIMVERGVVVGADPTPRT